MTIGLAVLVFLIACYAFLIEPLWVRVTRMDVSLPHWPSASNGFKAVYLTDLHVGSPLTNGAAVRKALRLCAHEKPDVIFLGGDLLRKCAAQHLLAPYLSKLKAKVGIFAVLGNHEHDYPGTTTQMLGLEARVELSEAQWREYLAGLGILLLVNEHRRVPIEGGEFTLVGVDDTFSGRADLAKALESAPENGPRILLSHSPDIVDEAKAAEVDLILCGHTHGGQICLPFLGPVLAPTRQPRQRSRGWVKGAPAPTYVSRGVGANTPLRFLSPPEVTVIKFRSAHTKLPQLAWASALTAMQNAKLKIKKVRAGITGNREQARPLKRVSICIYDEGAITPFCGHFKRKWRHQVLPFFKSHFGA